MADGTEALSLPLPEDVLRNLARNPSKALADCVKEDSATGVKELHDILDPILATADLPDLSPGHRAAASNAICAIIEFCQASASEHVRLALLDDSVWLRTLDIFLQRSDNAKGKSMRQMLLALTSVITKSVDPRANELRTTAASTFLDVICDRQDRMKVKPALQGLAHFILRDVVSIAQVVEIHEDINKQSQQARHNSSPLQSVFHAILAWVVHHDTALSAGHLVKNFLIQACKSTQYTASQAGVISPFWIEPVVWTLQEWPDRMQEFKTHVFQHCFLPNIEEYMHFLSYMGFSRHVHSEQSLPDALRILENVKHGLSESQEFRILLAAIEAGKEITIIRDIDYRVCNTIIVQDGVLQMPDDIFGNWMSHPAPEVRLAGMFLSVYSASITRHMTPGAFRSLRRNLPHLHTDTDANFRREVNGYTQKLFDRLRASTATLFKMLVSKRAPNPERIPLPKTSTKHRTASPGGAEQNALSEALSFVEWYVRFLEWELRPTASYQRRITALQSLTIVLRSGIDPGVPHSYLSKSAQGQLKWVHGLQIANAKLTRVLLDLILDPFDDVRSASVSVLQLCLLAQPLDGQNVVLSEMHGYLERAASTQLRTGRADQADGVARAWSLLFSLIDHYPGPVNPTEFASSISVYSYLTEALKSTVTYAHRDLAAAVNARPVHGYFAALRLIVDQDNFYDTVMTSPDEVFQQWKIAHDANLRYVEDFWTSVQHILCADAPEGHVPDEMDEEISLDTKEVLSYSWRGLKEASTLLRVMITKAPIGEDERSLISPTLYEKLGRLCFTQLLELRHRGAFSTVSQTFAAFCRRCATSNIPSVRALPEAWYQETLRSMQDKAGAITRRSAGIPALMASILAADTGDLFSRAMKDLVAAASVEAQSTNIEESRLPQVHALNCIKEFFTTSRLNVASEAYMGQGLELAARTLNSDIWPIRNCSLMLFKALIERLLGSDEAQDWKEQDRAKTSRFSYENYPSLVNILSDLLNPEGPLKQSIENTPDNSSPLDLHGAEGVFPALQILRQAMPPEAQLGSIVESVEKLLASPHWHLRDMAARTVVSLRPARQVRQSVSSLLAARPSSTNLQHGKLLALKYMLRKLLRDSSNLDLGDFEALLKDIASYPSSDCPFIQAVLLDIVSLCGITLLRRLNATTILPAWVHLTRSVEIGPDYALGVNKTAANALLRQSLASAFFIDRIILRNDGVGLLVSKNYQGIDEALALLAEQDPDACCAALGTLDDILKLNPSNGVAIPLDLVIAHIHSLVIKATDAEVISKAQAVLADALNNNHHKSAFFSLISQEQVLTTLTRLSSQCLSGPPSNMQTALHLLGSFLDFAHHTYPSQRPIILHHIVQYIRILRTTIIDTNPFDMRFAAVQSLAALKHIWTLDPGSKSTAPLLLGLAFVLYDMLNDDDDEIRDIAALASNTLFRTHINPATKSTVPLLTSQQLGTWLAHTFPRNANLVHESLRRLLNTPAPTPLFARPFETVLEDERREDTALFATEKQNLYKDDTLDAVLWMRVLSSIHVEGRKGVYADLHMYVVDALRVLVHTAQSERDGALGWLSKPEVFTLVVRVVCAAEVCLSWGTVGQRRDVIVALGRFADEVRKSEGHGLVVKRVERVLENEVLGMLRGVAGSLKGM
ncbi:HEAT repeat protein-like protein [Paraphoma chrysanthemicola]|nr:HEAT repeat protein-like protein [Paraphoma chrysanthemicola]